MVRFTKDNDPCVCRVRGTLVMIPWDFKRQSTLDGSLSGPRARPQSPTPAR